MGDRQPRRRARSPTGVPPAGPDVFAEFGLNAHEFEVQSGFGLAFIAHQRIVWMSVTHRPTGRKVSGKIGTTKKGKDAQHDRLLHILLQSFRRS